MAEIIGWVAYTIIIVAFAFNAKAYHKTAICLWILGDICWVIFNLTIDNYPHMALNFSIISINIYGIINLSKSRKPTILKEES